MNRRKRNARRDDDHSVAVGEKLPQRGLGHAFTRFSGRIAEWVGQPWAFIGAVAMILVWLVTGPIFNFSTEWQLYVNSATTVITFLMVFLIQNTQNRDARALHLKLDELLRATPKARKEFMEAEEEDLDEIEREKAIVAKDDPTPPADRAHKAPPEGQRGNGRP
ncbi:MAG TPA: low affinity iron permease family protein [Candidatus Limnocylindria bacterium]|nr:low affinity iron permease family protein [Candidatus Limnocylindria bacterium]